MGFRKASLLLYFLFFLHLQCYFFQAISRSTTRLVSADPNHDNLPVQSLKSKPDCDAFAGETAELAIVVHKGGGGGRGGGSFGGGGRSFGGGGRSFGGGGRSFGGGGRSFGGGGRSFGGGGRGKGGRTRGVGGRGVVPFVGGAGGSHHGGHHSSGGRESASVWLGLSTLLVLVLVF